MKMRVFWIFELIALLPVVAFQAISFVQPESGTFLNQFAWSLLVPFLIGAVALVLGGLFLIVKELRSPRKRIAMIALGVLFVLLPTWWMLVGLLPDSDTWFMRHFNLSV
jgi:hypothetical protein